MLDDLLYNFLASFFAYAAFGGGMGKLGGDTPHPVKGMLPLGTLLYNTKVLLNVKQVPLNGTG